MALQNRDWTCHLYGYQYNEAVYPYCDDWGHRWCKKCPCPECGDINPYRSPPDPGLKLVEISTGNDIQHALTPRLDLLRNGNRRAVPQYLLLYHGPKFDQRAYMLLVERYG